MCKDRRPSRLLHHDLRCPPRCSLRELDCGLRAQRRRALFLERDDGGRALKVAPLPAPARQARRLHGRRRGEWDKVSRTALYTNLFWTCFDHNPIRSQPQIDLYWIREAELKHSRVAMLAVVGSLAEESGFVLPGLPTGKNQIDLFWTCFDRNPVSFHCNDLAPLSLLLRLAIALLSIAFVLIRFALRSLSHRFAFALLSLRQHFASAR
jgi:hypothetical protein